MPVMRIDAAAPQALAAYLRARGWLAADDAIVSVGPAGDGNMNCTLRVATTRGSSIVKQGRPWVEKYPSIPAPPDRTLVEGAFYATVASDIAVAGRMPVVRGLDPESCVLVLEDCAGFVDASSVYEGHALAEAVLEELLDYLRALHAVPLTDAARAPWANHAMQALNHEYIHRLPLAGDAGLHERLDDITPGLSRLAREYSADADCVARVASLGERYLHGPPRALVHGDFFPGSWLTSGARVRVIDPEFCHAGAPEFDYGVMAAHLLLAGQEAAAARTAAAAVGHEWDGALVAACAGVEIMRRLVGVAQLPRLHRTLAEKAALLETSRRLVTGARRLDT